MKSPFHSAKQIVGTTTVQAPTGGLNALNPISNMPEGDAIIMRNFFPEPFGCRVRKGYREHATGLDGDVCSIMAYNGQDGVNKLFAADQSQIMEITAVGDYSTATAACTSTNPWWQSVQMSNPAGTNMVAFNGADNGILVNSTGVHRLTLGTVLGTDYEWIGIDPKKLVVPITHQHRLWAVEKDSTRAWYLPPEQLWGQAKSFDFGANFTRGGFLQTLIVYTQDSGYGPDDYIGAISSAGELVLYKGIDPESATDWALVGLFFIGSTFTRRCATRFGGDVAILTQYGMVTVGSITKPSETSVLDNALSQKIQYLISQLVTDGSYRYGWGIALFPAANMLLINVPGVVASQNLQLVYNTLTKAWSQFEGMIANCWGTNYGALAFGGNGVVYRAWEGNLDNVPLNGEGGVSIVAEVQQAFSYFGLPGATKHFKMLRPTMLYSGKFTYKAGANMDFDFASQPPPAAFSTSNFGVWNLSTWDTTYVWSGGAQSDKQWISVVGFGYAASIRMVIETSSDTVWVSTDWVMEKGGVV